MRAIGIDGGDRYEYLALLTFCEELEDRGGRLRQLEACGEDSDKETAYFFAKPTSEGNVESSNA